MTSCTIQSCNPWRTSTLGLLPTEAGHESSIFKTTLEALSCFHRSAFCSIAGESQMICFSSFFQVLTRNVSLDQWIWSSLSTAPAAFGRMSLRPWGSSWSISSTLWTLGWMPPEWEWFSTPARYCGNMLFNLLGAFTPELVHNPFTRGVQLVWCSVNSFQP